MLRLTPVADDHCGCCWTTAAATARSRLPPAFPRQRVWHIRARHHGTDGSSKGSATATHLPFQHAPGAHHQAYLFRSVLEHVLPAPVKASYTGTVALAPPRQEHPPVPPLTGYLALAAAAVLLVGAALEKWWWNLRQDVVGGEKRKKNQQRRRVRQVVPPAGAKTPAAADRPRPLTAAPAGTGASAPAAAAAARPNALGTVLMQKDLGRKESVEWVNMVLGKVWKVYRRALEGWVVGLVQPLIDNLLKKPDWVRRVEIKQFFLGDEPLSVRSVERRTSRHANDLQYHIGLRYTGGARLLLLVSLKFGLVPITVPVAVRGLDLDAEVWVKLRLVPQPPFVGTATWAFVTQPKIKLALAPFRLLNVMAIPLLSIFLEKLLTRDLPQLFVRPNKNVLDFMQGRAVGPIPREVKAGDGMQGNKDFAGELSVTLINARKLTYFPIGKTDPYVVLILGEQVMRSKRNSETSVFGPPGEPIWNQDFQFVVVNPQSQHLSVRVRDNFGLGIFTVGFAEVNLGALQDTVPVDRVVSLKSTFPKRFGGELIMRLTYKEYVEDEEEDGTEDRPYLSGNPMGGKMPDMVEELAELARFWNEEAQKAQEMFLNSNYSSGSDRKDDWFPRGMAEDSGRGGNKDGTLSGYPQQLHRMAQNPVLVWLGVAAGIAVLAAFNLNFSNVFNP